MKKQGEICCNYTKMNKLYCERYIYNAILFRIDGGPSIIIRTSEEHVVVCGGGRRRVP